MQIEPRLRSTFRYRASAVLVDLPHLYEAVLIDISEHGVLAELKENADITLGDRTLLRVLTEKGNQAFEVQALVVHRSGQIVGLEIHCIDRHARSILHRLIETDQGAPNLAARTFPVLLRANLSASPAR
jgi:hypothetical protein